MLATGLATGAQAATGPLDYVSADGDEYTLEDPADGECFLLVGGARTANNGTNARATFYEEPGDCESQTLGTLQPGMARSFEGGTLPRAVRFG
ncbi:hypothetical protein [Streptomyces sp. NPDC004266]|uniref:hypothetical protein n=1 Tax=Streptomyces sp. NPDC004266 TaxID=3364693 RepID=UPI00369E240E